jgi:ent-kaurene oxidase
LLWKRCTLVEKESEIAFKQHKEGLTDWTLLKPQLKLVSVVAQVTGRIFVGLPLGRQTKCLKASIEHSIAVVPFAHRLRKFPVWAWPFIAPFLTEGCTVACSNADIKKLVTPFIKEKIGSFAAVNDDINTKSDARGIIEDGRLIG